MLPNRQPRQKINRAGEFENRKEPEQSENQPPSPASPSTGAKEFIEALSSRAPHAQIGYSKEIEKLYGENPARFRPGG